MADPEREMKDLRKRNALHAEIERLRSVLIEIATGRDKNGKVSDFPRDVAAEALSKSRASRVGRGLVYRSTY